VWRQGNCPSHNERSKIFSAAHFALSTKLTFLARRNTGLILRKQSIDRFPRTDSDYFGSIAEYDNYVKLLSQDKMYRRCKENLVDIRAHPYFNTLNPCMRHTDESWWNNLSCSNYAGVVAKLHKLIKQNLGFRIYRRALIAENKWRASRYGIHGKLIDFGKQEEVEFKSLSTSCLSYWWCGWSIGIERRNKIRV